MQKMSSQLRAFGVFKNFLLLLFFQKASTCSQGLGVFCENSQLSEGMEVWETKNKEMHW